VDSVGVGQQAPGFSSSLILRPVSCPVPAADSSFILHHCLRWCWSTTCPIFQFNGARFTGAAAPDAMFSSELSMSDAPACRKHGGGAQPEPGRRHIRLYTYSRMAARIPDAFLGHGRRSKSSGSMALLKCATGSASASVGLVSKRHLRANRGLLAGWDVAGADNRPRENVTQSSGAPLSTCQPTTRWNVNPPKRWQGQ